MRDGSELSLLCDEPSDTQRRWVAAGCTSASRCTSRRDCDGGGVAGCTTRGVLAPALQRGVTADDHDVRVSTRPSLKGGQGGKMGGAPVRVCCSSRMHGVAAHLLELVLLRVA